MYFDFWVKIPVEKGKIFERTIKRVTYINYEYDRVYNAGQYYPDYAYNHPLFTAGYKIYSDSTVSEFIGEISVDDSVEFQNEWNALKKNKDKIHERNPELKEALKDLDDFMCSY